MKDNNKQHDNDRHYCCCCCYCCCCDNGQHLGNEENNNNDRLQSTESLPPWLPPPPPPPTDANDRLSPNLDSICSCCSCTSSIEDIKPTTEAVEEDEEESPSTGCTTPIDLKIVDSNNLPDIIEKTRKKKLHALEELLQTERDYVQDLSYLVEVCLEALSRQHWITTEHKSIIMRNSYEILAFHKKFIISFDSLENSSFIAKKFIDQMDQFSLYTYYCDMHAEAWTLTSEYRDRPEWNIFVKDCAILDSHLIPLSHLLIQDDHQLQLQQQQQKKLHFEDYLIKPVQRICRYQLLIKEILKYTSTQTSEFDLWSIVLSEMQDVVTEIDNKKFERDMKERTDKFIDRFEGDWRISKRHVSQLGSLLVSGAIEVTYSALGQTVSKPRYLGCFIFQTYIIMVRPKKVTSYEPKHWFPLRMTEFEDLADIEGQREHSFILRCKKHAFAFSASCSQEKQLWVKKIQEAIVAAKIEASDENLSAQDFIVSSLSGITSKRSPQSIRLSKSFTNLLDMTLTANNEVDKKSSSAITTVSNNSAFDKKSLRRSASTSIQFEDIIKLTMQHPPLPTSKTVSNLSSALDESPTTTNIATNNLVSLKKRYSADYSAFATRKQQQQHQLGLKPRNNSEMYIKPDSFGSSSGLTRRRPSSLDLLSAANNTSNMIGKMSSQLKSNHQNALKVTVDHKLRDVCTQDYLSSRAWHIRDRDAGAASASSSYYQQPSPIIDTTTTQNQMSNNSVGIDTSTTSATAPSDVLKKRKSTSFIRSSASNFSIIMPKRTSESKSNIYTTNSRYQSEYELQSNASSCASSVLDRSSTPVNGNNSASRRPSQSSQLLRKVSENSRRGRISESPISFENSSSVSSFNNDKRIERSPSRRQIFVGKVLRRIASFHQKSPSSPTSFDRSSSSSIYIESDEVVKKAASVGAKKNKMKWKRHEELVQLQVAVNDRPFTPLSMSSANSDLPPQQQSYSPLSPSPQPQATIPIAAFAYASTPPSSPVTNIPRKSSNSNINRSWKNRLSLIRPASFLRVSSSNSSSNIHTSSFNSSSSRLS